MSDANIPCVDDAFGDFGEVDRVPGREIGPAAVADADVLLVRSVTAVGSSLLAGSSVSFVGSATIGTDHVDEAFLRERGIAFAHAPASNADSVADYVVAALCLLARRRGVALRDKTVGIVGCGNIGGRLVRRLSALGPSVLRNDPPRAAEAGEDAPPFVSLESVLDRADIVTLHVPLTTDGPHPTHHLIDADALSHVRAGAWLVNTSRGPVVEGNALLEAVKAGRVGAAALDVWEDEPSPDPALVRAVDVATPHIAGYAWDGKVRGTRMLYKALCDHLGVEPTWTPTAVLRPAHPDAFRCQGPDPRLPRPDWWDDLVRQAYDLRADDARMRGILRRPRSEHGAYFRHLRATYPRRRELRRFTVPRASVPEPRRAAVEAGLTLRGRPPGDYDR